MKKHARRHVAAIAAWIVIVVMGASIQYSYQGVLQRKSYFLLRALTMTAKLLKMMLGRGRRRLLKLMLLLLVVLAMLLEIGSRRSNCCHDGHK